MSFLGPSLAATPDPRALVPGSVESLTNDSTSLADRADELLDVVATLGRVLADGWTGEAADAAHDRIESLREDARRAAQAFAIAAAALSAHADVLAWGQREAATCVAVYRSGAYCSPEQNVFDPYTPEQHRAMDRLEDVRVVVADSARDTAAALDDATSLAPRAPGAWNEVGKQWSSLWHGAAESFTGLGKFAYEGSTIRAAIDPVGWWNSRVDLIVGLYQAVQDPKQLGKDLVDWDTWATDPARAVGHLAPDAVIAALTAGAGTVATRAGTAGVKAAEKAAETAAAAASKTATKEAVEEAAKRTGPRPTSSFTDEELGRLTPGTGPVIFKARADLTPEEIGQTTAYVRSANAARLEGELSPTGRVSTVGVLRRDADAAVEAERLRATAAGTPYKGEVGHGPDSTWTGSPVPRDWIDQTRRVNGSLGGTASRYDIGYVPTIFQVRFQDGTLFPQIVGGPP